MAFTNMEEENLDIYFMNLSEGSTIQRVTNTDEKNYFLSDMNHFLSEILMIGIIFEVMI